MPEQDKTESTPKTRTADVQPLVFISHDTRDAEFAEAFSKLLRSVSAGMLKSFRSSDRQGTEGIEFGDEWYRRLMLKLASASDVVFLFTEHSLDRPWILYEAGVAKGKLETPVEGVAIGVPLSRLGTGPFYHFHNSDDSVESLTKLVTQLARRIPALELDAEVVKTQVQTFKSTCEKLLAKLSDPKEKKEKPPLGDDSVAKLFEEVKAMFRDLPSRLEERVAEGIDPMRRRRLRRFHPGMIRDIIAMLSEKPGDPIAMLVIASLLRDEVPWLYEIGVHTYRAALTGDQQATEDAFSTFRRAVQFTMKGPFMEMLGGSKEMHMLLMELPMVLEMGLEGFGPKAQMTVTRDTKPST